MKYLLPAVVAVLALGWLTGPSEARMRMQAMKPATPEQFIQKVANANQFEIELEQARPRQIQKRRNPPLRAADDRRSYQDRR